jgi:excisionase family DNA binding protein
MSRRIEAPPQDERLINYRGASRVIDTPVATLQVWVSTGRYGIPFYKVGRKVRFKKGELLRWLATRKHGSSV